MLDLRATHIHTDPERWFTASRTQRRLAYAELIGRYHALTPDRAQHILRARRAVSGLQHPSVVSPTATNVGDTNHG